MKNYLALFLSGLLLYGCSGNSPKTPADEAVADDSPVAIVNDLENALAGVPSWSNEKTIVEMPEGIAAHSGKYVSRVDAENQYSYAFKEIFANINQKLPVAVIVEGYVYSPEVNPLLGIVMDINDNNNKVIWKSYALSEVISSLNEWKPFAARFTIDAPIKPEYQLKIFASGAKKTAYFDDFKISFEY